jgi:hypothetical protein
LLSGCIDEFKGSNVQVDFSAAMKVQASPGQAPTAEQFPNNIHFTLYAFEETSGGSGTMGFLFELQKFEIHRIVDLSSPCFIDVGDHVPFEGLHVSQFEAKVKEAKGIPDIANPPASATEQDLIDVATAMQRLRNVNAYAGAEGPKVVSSVSDDGYLPVAANCTDTGLIPPPTCTDDASNARRLAMCQEAWKADETLFEGTDRILTAPLNGISHGMVIGMNPVNFAPVGGAQFFVDEALEDFDGFAIYWQYDDVDANGEPDYPPQVPPADRHEAGELLLFGRPSKPTRGVIHVSMTSLVDPAITADLAVFTNIDDDEVHF